MKSKSHLILALLLAGIPAMMTSCLREIDPGPLQNDERTYALTDFDHLEMGDAFVITIIQSPVYTIHVRGDRRNLDDLGVSKVGSTLKVKYNNNENHQHTTYVDVTMPLLAGANLSGATNSSITGFKSVNNFELTLSGASLCQVNAEIKNGFFNLSGASRLNISGKADNLNMKASGASELYAYDMVADVMEVEVTGASLMNVFAVQSLKATASGASRIFYRGSPALSVSVSGASTVQQE